MRAIALACLLAAIGVMGDCTGNLCTNGATCVSTGGSYTCTCAHAWVGDHCDVSAGCDAAPFNIISPPSATVQTAVYGGVVSAAANVFVTTQAVNGLLYPVVSYVTSDGFGTLSAPQRLNVSMTQPIIASSEDASVVAVGTLNGVFAAHIFTMSGSVFALAHSSFPGSINSNISAVAINHNWLVMMTFSDFPTLEFHRANPNGYQYFTSLTYSFATVPTNGMLSISGECSGDVYIAFGAPGDDKVVVARHNTTAFLTEWGVTQTLTYSSLRSALTVSACTNLVIASAEFNGAASYSLIGSVFSNPQSLPIPDLQSGEQCGTSVSASDTTLAIGCPQYTIGNGDTGRAIKYTLSADSTAWINPVQLTDHCASTFAPGATTSFGSGVGVSSMSVAVGMPQFDNYAGAVLQFGASCTNNTCIAGNTCVAERGDPTVHMCVCTVSPTPCSLATSSSSSSGGGTGGISSSTGHDHGNSATPRANSLFALAFPLALVVALLL
jgi:hypothetical protein